MKRYILIGLTTTMLLVGGLPAHGLPVEKMGLLGESITLCDPRSRSTEAENRRCAEAINRWQRVRTSSEASEASPSPHVAQPGPPSSVLVDHNLRQWAEFMAKRRSEEVAEYEALNRMWKDQCAHYNIRCDQPPWEREKQREEAMIAQYKSLPLEEYLEEHIAFTWEEKYFISNEQVNDFFLRQWCTPKGILCDVTLFGNAPPRTAIIEEWCLDKNHHWWRGPGCETQMKKYTTHPSSPLLRLLELTSLATNEEQVRNAGVVFTKWWNETRQRITLVMQSYCNSHSAAAQRDLDDIRLGLMGAPIFGSGSTGSCMYTDDGAGSMPAIVCP